MIGNQQNGTAYICVFEIVDPENIHQIVRGDIDPERAYMTLTERPEPLPNTQIHPMREPKPRPLNAAQGFDL